MECLRYISLCCTRELAWCRKQISLYFPYIFEDFSSLRITLYQSRDVFLYPESPYRHMIEFCNTITHEFMITLKMSLTQEKIERREIKRFCDPPERQGLPLRSHQFEIGYLDKNPLNCQIFFTPKIKPRTLHLIIC